MILQPFIRPKRKFLSSKRRSRRIRFIYCNNMQIASSGSQLICYEISEFFSTPTRKRVYQNQKISSILSRFVRTRISVNYLVLSMSADPRISGRGMRSNLKGHWFNPGLTPHFDLEDVIEVPQLQQ